MAPDVLAPWAEPVLLTADDLLAHADHPWRYELVEGRLVRMPPTGYEHGNVALNLLRAIDTAVRDLGRVSPPETGFLVSRPGEPDTVLAPDLAFISAARIPQPGSRDWKGFPRLAPDLVVEIALPTQRPPELAVKARRWLAAGVRLVWVVWHATRQVDAWHPGSDVPSVTLDEMGELDGHEVLPGFTYPVAELFS